MPWNPWLGSGAPGRTRRRAVRSGTLLLCAGASAAACFLFGGCATLGSTEHRSQLCVELALHGHPFPARSFDVRVFEDGRMSVGYGSFGSRVKRIKGLDGRQLCAMLVSLNSPESECPVLHSGEYTTRLEGPFLLEVSSPGPDEFAVDVMRTLWGETCGLTEGEFGRGLRMVDEILRHRFRKWACSDSGCSRTQFSIVMPWPGP